MSGTTIHVGTHAVGPGNPCFVIAEVAQAHDGSLGLAHSFIDAIADAGADAVKFQTHIAAAESTKEEPWRVKFSSQDASRYDYWKRMEFTAEQWAGLKRHAEDRGLVFLSSPFSLVAVELLERLGIVAWKIASGEVNNPLLLRRIAETRLPVLLSSGMSSWEEIDRAVELFRKRSTPLAVLQCTTAYPCPPERVGLSLLSPLRQRYGCPVGLSDHSGTIYAGLAAAALGADLLEVHVTLSRQMFGPDVPASVTPGELSQLVQGVRFIQQALGADVDKDQVAREMYQLKRTFGKSVVARVDLPQGTVLQAHHLTVKKPGGGIAADQFDQLIGRRLTVDVQADEPLQTGMLAEGRVEAGTLAGFGCRDCGNRTVPKGPNFQSPGPVNS